MASGLGVTRAAQASEAVVKLKDRMMFGIADRAGENAAARARLLLDHVIDSLPEEALGDEAAFMALLVDRARTFVLSSGGEPEGHFRLVGANHLLVNMLQPVVEGTDDEYITTEYEELSDGLDDLERIDISNPSLNNRLSSIFDELIELSKALGIGA
ncbi:MAG: hypothetical protein SA339_10480 [Methanomassiliicoccus sp.]|nr:hypothetical protein [Methanomassiliicoccus sp.]